MITIFSGATGLNTVEDPVRIGFQKNGLTDLQVAVNISIDQSLRINRRTGVTRINTGSYHSLFCDGGGCFVVKDDSLYQVGDGALTGLRSGLTTGQKVSFAQAGDRTYYTNGYENGYIYNGASRVWAKGTYTGVETNRQFSEPPIGSHLAIFGSRMFISENNVLWWSEPFNFGLYDKAESFVQFYDNIRMVQPVAGGIYVSTTKKTYFLNGNLPKEFVFMEVAQFPAIEWSNAVEKIDAADIGLDGGLCAVWASREGAILGAPTGQIFNLNKNKVVYPDNATTGFGCLKGYNFIHGVN